MEEYSIVQKRHKLLAEQNRALQQTLAEKEAELAQIHADAVAAPAQASATVLLS